MRKIIRGVVIVVMVLTAVAASIGAGVLAAWAGGVPS